MTTKWREGKRGEAELIRAPAVRTESLIRPNRLMGMLSNNGKLPTGWGMPEAMPEAKATLIGCRIMSNLLFQVGMLDIHSQVKLEKPLRSAYWSLSAE